MVACFRLNNMHQDWGETVCVYCARLHGQANVWKYTVECPNCCNINCIDSFLCNMLCRGVKDTEIQLNLLGYTNQDMMLKKVLQFVEAKETELISLKTVSHSTKQCHLEFLQERLYCNIVLHHSSSSWIGSALFILWQERT